jgi:hypothetical protein
MTLNSPRTLGFVLIAWGILGSLAVAVMVALLSAPWFEGETWRVPPLSSPLMIFALISLVGATLSMIAGSGLRRSSSWARPLAYVASVAALTTVPIGTLVGAFGLVVLLSNKNPVA